MHSETPSPPNEGVLEILRKLHVGAVDPQSISKEDRRTIVGYLMVEGHSTVEIAGILKVDERTIRRDKQKNREVNALQYRPALVEEMVGSLVREAETAHQKVRQATRDKAASPLDRIHGARACWIIQKELTELLQRLGYLPTAPTEVRGELLHHVKGGMPNAAALIEDIERVAAIMPADSEQADELEALKKDAHKINLVERLNTLTAQAEEVKEGTLDE